MSKPEEGDAQRREWESKHLDQYLTPAPPAPGPADHMEQPQDETE